MTRRINSLTVGLPVADVDLAVVWYRSLLGKMVEINPAPGVRELQITSSSWLQLFEGDSDGSSPVIVRFESDDIDASRALAISLARDVGGIRTVAGAVRYFDFRDPFGNRLSFYEVMR